MHVGSPVLHSNILLLLKIRNTRGLGEIIDCYVYNVIVESNRLITISRKFTKMTKSFKKNINLNLMKF